MKDLAGATFSDNLSGRNPDFASGELLAYNVPMLPIILETTSEAEQKNFVDEFIIEHDIKPYNYFVYEPELKELSIKQIREIVAETTFHSTEKRLFHILRFDSASTEAQNAFLKTLEEHQSNLLFILSVEQASKLLPTIRSRSRVTKLSSTKTSKLTAELQTLIETLASGKLPTLFRITNQIGKADSLKFFDSLMGLYRDRLATDKHAGKVLKNIITQQNLLKHNHVDAQTTIDATLISIYKIYNQ